MWASAHSSPDLKTDSEEPWRPRRVTRDLRAAVSEPDPLSSVDHTQGLNGSTLSGPEQSQHPFFVDLN